MGAPPTGKLSDFSPNEQAYAAGNALPNGDYNAAMRILMQAAVQAQRQSCGASRLRKLFLEALHFGPW